MKLYWLICAGLLLAGTVEAGEPAQCEYVLASGHLRNSCELLEIGPGVNPFLQNASFIACYQRMREAMRVMDEYVQGRKGWYIFEPSKRRVPDWNIDSEAKHQWDAIMKECVQ